MYVSDSMTHNYYNWVLWVVVVIIVFIYFISFHFVVNLIFGFGVLLLVGGKTYFVIIGATY